MRLNVPLGKVIVAEAFGTIFLVRLDVERSIHLGKRGRTSVCGTSPSFGPGNLRCDPFYPIAGAIAGGGFSAVAIHKKK